MATTRRNFFEILGLTFDPPETNKRRIEQAIEAWDKEINDRIANAPDPAKRAAYEAEKALKPEIVRVMNDPKEKGNEASALKKERLGQLNAIIDILQSNSSGKVQTSNAQIREISNKLGLSISTTKEVFKKREIPIQEIKRINLSDVFFRTTDLAAVMGNVTAFGDIVRRENSTGRYPWADSPKDVYEFLCYLTGGGDPKEFHRKKTNDLCLIAKNKYSQTASDMSTSGHAVNAVLTACTSKIFDSEQNRKRYDNSMLLKKLSDFFALLKNVPTGFKKEQNFAEECIKKIQAYFPNYDLALAIYNQEAGLVADPYEPFQALVRVVCATCNSPLSFTTYEEAEKAVCPNCHSPLYIECPKCHKKVPASADRCSCGFSVSEMHFFGDYCDAAAAALKEYDIGEAQRQLAKAEAAWPGHPKLAALNHDIDDVAKRFQQPLDELNTLLAARMYFKADKVASDLLAKMPQLKIDGIRKTIKEKLDLAAKTMPKAGLDQFAKGDALVDVLEIVKDYRPALDALMGLPIKAPSRLIAAIDEEEHQSCHLSWTPSGSKGVTYVVVRKENGIPANNGDGKIVGSDISEPSFVDSSISPGSVYGYAVFGMRHGVCSSGASASIEVLTAIGKDTLLISSGDGLCKFSWTLPANADGVRILRREGSIPTSDKQAGTVVLSDLSLASYEDRSVKNGSTYGYCFQVAYHFGDSFKYSKGYSVLVTPEAPPKVMTDISTKVSGQMVNISWECKQNNKWRVIAQEALSESSSLIGQVISLQELTRAIGGGKVLGEADASNKKMSFSLPENTAKLAALITVSGSNGVISQFIHISTVPKVLINKARTVVENINLKLVLETPLPKYLNRIFYLASPKGVNDRTPPWAKPEDAKNGSMKAVTPKQYLEDGLILVRNLPSQDIYVSVIGEYIIGGMTFYSDPEKLRVHNLEKETIEYEIAWGRGFLGRIKAEGAVLKITCKADFVPELALCYRDDGLVPLRIDDPNVKKICVIPEQASGYSGNQYSFPIPNGVWSSVRSGTALRILLKADDAKEFKLAPKNAGSLLVP